MNSPKSSAHKRVAQIFSPIMTATALGLLLAGCGTTAVDVGDENDDAMMKSSVSSEAMMESSVDGMMKSDAATMQLYRDGTFTAAGAYQSPAGGESVHVTLTLKDGVVTEATFSGDATHPKSQAMQAAFAEGFEEQVVGKPLDEVSVGVVNGSSLTGGGFMDAVGRIKLEAKA